MNMRRISDRTYVITGAASGLGRELAMRLSHLGATLVLIDKNFKGLEDFAETLPPERTETIVFDLAKTAELESRFGKVFLEKKEKLYGLVNCAAEEHDGFFDDIPLEILRRNIEVNFWAPIILSRLIAPILKEKREGQIINVVSDMAFRTVPGRLAYSASKAALKSFSECLRMELKPYGVDGISVFPGVMRTPFWEAVTTYPRMVAPPPDSRPSQTASEVADFIMKKLGKGKSIIRQINLTKIFLLFDAVFPMVGDKIIFKGAKVDKSNL